MVPAATISLIIFEERDFVSINKYSPKESKRHTPLFTNLLAHVTAAHRLLQHSLLVTRDREGGGTVFNGTFSGITLAHRDDDVLVTNEA